MIFEVFFSEFNDVSHVIIVYIRMVKFFFLILIQKYVCIYTGVPKKEDESITPLFIGRF
jgi:hypothetical protein